MLSPGLSDGRGVILLQIVCRGAPNRGMIFRLLLKEKGMSSKIENVKKELLSDNWYVLHKYTFDLKRKNGGSVQQMREVYDRGNGATILLYNRAKGTVVLTNQFRMPTYVNGNESGMLLEACAGLLDADSPEQCARREAVEETGFQVSEVKIFEAYMSPGGVTEIVHFFIAEYHDDERRGRRRH